MSTINHKYNQLTIEEGSLDAISIGMTKGYDEDGNILLKHEQRTVTMELDNYQAFQLAIEILKRVDVNDTRGSN